MSYNCNTEGCSIGDCPNCVVVAALRMDQRRLDWLCDTAMLAPVMAEDTGPTGIVLAVGSQVSEQGYLRDDLRAAIDAARTPEAVA